MREVTPRSTVATEQGYPRTRDPHPGAQARSEGRREAAVAARAPFTSPAAIHA